MWGLGARTIDSKGKMSVKREKIINMKNDQERAVTIDCMVTKRKRSVHRSLMILYETADHSTGFGSREFAHHC